jgi:hypothetical protein
MVRLLGVILMLFQRQCDGEGVIMAASPRRLQALHREGQAKIAARNAAWWLWAHLGLHAAEIAHGFGSSTRTVQRGIAAAERLRQRLGSGGHENLDCIPYFGCGPWERILVEFRDHAESPICPVCDDAIEPGDCHVCMCCHASGYDNVLARSLGRAVLEGTSPLSEPAPQRHRTARSTAAVRPPILSQKVRAALAETPQGLIWLESIDQPPSAAAVARRAEQRQRRRPAWQVRGPAARRRR